MALALSNGGLITKACVSTLRRSTHFFPANACLAGTFCDEGDLWPVQAVRATVLTNTPRFEHVVISATGRLMLMRTIAPGPFIEFKLRMAASAEHRPEAKRRSNIRQADIVQHLLDNGLLIP